MTHMVIVHTSNDKTYHPCDGLQAAVTTMERFRNEEGVESLELFQLSPVEFEFKTYYHVAIAGADEAPATPSHLASVAPAPVPETQVSEHLATEVEASNAATSAADADPFDTPAIADPYSDHVVAEQEPVEVPMAAAPSVVPFPTAQPTEVAEAAEAAIVPPPAPAVAVPAPAGTTEASPMFAEPFEADPLFAQHPAPPVDAPAGSGLGFELAPQSEHTASPFAEVPPVNGGLLPDAPPPPPAPVAEETDILAEMADIADSKEKEPRRGLFGR